jgi:diadenosine tetraphosphate (Ap4A) HIT family hydrolase
LLCKCNACGLKGDGNREMPGDNCELCATAGGTVLWEGAGCRVVRVADPHYPGFCRVILNEHAREMTDLPTERRRAMMDVVFAVERALRALFSPDKINLASLGNLTPHLHWHVIPRWCDDRHFPEPVWGKMHREGAAIRPAVSDEALRLALEQLLSAARQEG